MAKGFFKQNSSFKKQTKIFFQKFNFKLMKFYLFYFFHKTKLTKKPNKPKKLLNCKNNNNVIY